MPIASPTPPMEVPNSGDCYEIALVEYLELLHCVLPLVK
jgi:hypothetical protein